MNSSQLPGTLGLSDPGRLYLGVKWKGRIHHDHRKSWMSPDVLKLPRLLFAGEYDTGDVYILTLPDLTEKGLITGFQQPQGECSDKSGNIYIADSGTFTVSKWNREGKELRVYDDTYGYPESCAVNPLNGDVAVTNSYSLGGTEGEVVIFAANPSTPPTVVSNPQQFLYNFAGYDPSGNLWVDGLTAPSGDFILSSCGSSSCSTITTSGGTIYFPGAVQWDRVRNTWVVFDQLCNNQEGSCSYPVSGSGVLGAPTNYLDYLGNPACDLVQGVIAANWGHKYVVGGDDDYCGFAENTFSRWMYTAGGDPTNHSLIKLEAPSGAAVSNK